MIGLYLEIYIELLGRCQHFTKLMKKRVSFVWDNACQQAFKEIREYLTHPPVLVAPASEKTFPVIRLSDGLFLGSFTTFPI